MSAEAAAAQAALNVVMGISSGITARANINAANTVNAANTYAANLIRNSKNELAAKRTSLARFTQSVNNQRVLENAGSAFTAQQVNYRRGRDVAARDDFEGQVRFAEQAGAQAAASAVSGLTGGVADIVRGTTALRKSRIQQAVDQSLSQGDYDAAQRNKAIMVAGWDSLDQSELTTALDYGKNVATEQRYGGNLWSDAMSGTSGKDIKAIADFASSNFKTGGTGGGQQVDPLDSFYIN